jgi:hypothetical protein
MSDFDARWWAVTFFAFFCLIAIAILLGLAYQALSGRMAYRASVCGWNTFYAAILVVVFSVLARLTLACWNGMFS